IPAIVMDVRRKMMIEASLPFYAIRDEDISEWQGSRTALVQLGILSSSQNAAMSEVFQNLEIMPKKGTEETSLLKSARKFAEVYDAFDAKIYELDSFSNLVPYVIEDETKHAGFLQKIRQCRESLATIQHEMRLAVEDLPIAPDDE